MTNDKRLVLARELVEALEHGNESTISQVLCEISAIRENQLYQEVGRLTRQLHDTMEGFHIDSKLSAMTQNDIPDAKERLQHVISMTEQSANKTLNVVEDLVPISENLNFQASTLAEKWGRFLDREMPFLEFKNMSTEITHHFQQSTGSIQHIQSGLNEILLAQGYQDITGQIIKRVIDLVQDLETNMIDLIRISGGKTSESMTMNKPDLAGPIVPGIDDKAGDVATNQDEVDDLLLSLGF